MHRANALVSTTPAARATAVHGTTPIEFLMREHRVVEAPEVAVGRFDTFAGDCRREGMRVMREWKMTEHEVDVRPLGEHDVDILGESTTEWALKIAEFNDAHDGWQRRRSMMADGV